MRNRFIFLSLLLFICQFGLAQITTDPEFPAATKQVVVTFDSSQDSRLGKYTGDLYAHTGVKIEGNNDWQHVIGSWGDNAAQPKLTHLGDGIYKLEITPDINSYYSVPANEKVLQLAFVFRSADGSKQTNDIIIDVYEEGLIVNLTSPSQQTIFPKNEDTSISATASAEGELKLLLNETLLAQTTGTSLTTTYQFTEEGDQWLIAKLTANGETVYDSVSVYIKKDITQEAKPANYRKGINYPEDQTTAGLVLWAPEKEFVYLLGDFNDWQVNEAYQMKKDGDYFWLTIENLQAGQDYLFQYLVDGDLKIADPYAEQVSDPWNDQYIDNSLYPNLPSYPDGKTEGIASVLRTGQTAYTWEVTDFQAPETDELVIYELLVRDFYEGHSFQAVIDRLDYLEDLNINVLELMPVNEFEGNSSWGYNPSFYFAPDKYYGPKNDLKKLVDECHKRGIAVVIDMVLNHSYGQSPLAQLYWNTEQNRPAANNPWYNETSNFQNPDAQWGYDFNHESEYTRQLIDSINSFWMSEYQIDGFRFDFTKGFSNTSYGPSSWGSPYDADRIANLKRMADEIWNRNEDALIIFEHLSDNSEEKELAEHGILLWGNINHNYGEAAMGYTQNTNSDLSWGIYSERDWSVPNLVSYMESHDEERLAFKLIQYGNYSGTYNTKNLPIATDRLELNNVFFIPLPGPKMIWQFGELAYDYSIDDGGRLGEKPIRWDYTEVKDRTDLFQVVAKLNYLKQNYEEFQTPEIVHSLEGTTKWYQLKQGANYVIAVGNFGVTQEQFSVSFPTKGTWYNYFDETTYEVTSTTMTFTLAPGEYRLLSTRQFEQPDIVTENPELVLPNEIEVYPNPVSDYVTIQSPSPLVQASLYSIQGSLLHQFFGQETFHTMQLSHLQKGTYILKIKTESTKKTIKLIKR
ncbi:alpha-amylase family glycosyl hydrolase [uncultured Sunxiuqinia sp.]|uniref:alpha-amylase family glycosyl hydrolase n=1 Tax=uncultured Sunxiuqinia sp. TaxID=1573825 RepID=UPI002604EC68|nr:alpha-amylase family glycosyl hydrolase [uncultured Sunxiuqinia sp.]